MPTRTSLSKASLRREEFTAVATRGVTTSICSLGTYLAVMVTFWGDGPREFLCGILLLLAVLHGLTIWRSRTWLSGPRSNLSDLQLAARVLTTALIALAWSSVLFKLMPSGTNDQRQLLVYVFSGLTTSSLLLAPVLPAALVMAGTTTTAMLCVTPLLHQTISLQHTLMIVLFLAMTIITIRAQNLDFRRRFENEVTMQQQRNTIALLLQDFEDGASDWLWTVDSGFRLAGPLDRFCAAAGCAESTLTASDLRSFLDRSRAQRAGGDVERFLSATEARTPFREARLPFVFGGERVWLCLSGRPVIEDGVFAGYRGAASNITEAQDASDHIAHLARFDSLTGLPNRTSFGESLRAAAPRSHAFALFCLDLEGFKRIKDTYGHGIGDELLVMVAGRLRACLCEDDVVCRLDGGEFAIFAAHSGEESAPVLAERLIATIARPFAIRDMRISLSLGVGIVLRRGSASPEQLMQAGDIALSVSRRRGRGIWSLFEPSMADAMQDRHRLQNDLRDAIENNGLCVAYQPIIDVRSRRVTCVEALARWAHPTRGMVGPDRFIPLAEENGLIVALGASVLRQACVEAAGWPDDVRVAVNLSPLQLQDPGLLSTVDTVLAAAGLDPRRLEIEITESVFLDNVSATVERLQALRARGIRISLDDFGTGYSSLSYLRSFPFDKVKIDRSFVRDIGESLQALSIVKAIVGMAGSLDMDTTVEGVETARQAEMLELAGCNQFQGFLFGRPCERHGIGQLITAHNQAGAAAGASPSAAPVMLHKTASLSQNPGPAPVPAPPVRLPVRPPL